MQVRLVELSKVNSVLNKKETSEYVRASFLTEDKQDIRFNLSFSQWAELKEKINLSVNEVSKKVSMTPIEINVDETKTYGDKNKPALERRVGNYEGYDFNYIQLHIGVLIDNNFVSPSVDAGIDINLI